MIWLVYAVMGYGVYMVCVIALSRDSPGDYVHDINWSYGHLVLHVPFVGWLARRQAYRRATGPGHHYTPENDAEWRIYRDFHNCTRTGVK